MHSSNANEGLDQIAPLGYDPRDINVPEIVRWMSYFVAFVVVSIFAALWIYGAFTPNWVEEEKALPKYVTQQRMPPFPRVQGDPVPDMVHYLTAQEPKLEAVAKAKEAMAARGIAGVVGETPKAEGESYPGSGRYAGAERGHGEQGASEGAH